MIKLTITLIFSLFFSSFAIPAQTEISAVSAVDRSTITVGDRIHYTIEIIYPEGTEIEAPGLGIHLGSFEVKDYDVGEPEKQKDGTMRVRYAYRISTFTTGEYAIPPVEIRYKMPGGMTASILTDKIDIRVESVKPSESGDIKDIKPPAVIRGGLDWWWWVLFGLIAAIGACAAVYYWMMNRKKTDAAVPLKPPYDEAVEALEQLLSEGLPARGKTKEYYFRLSEITRRYLGRCFEFNAIDCTTTELIEQTDQLDITEEIKESIRRFGTESDWVKFADHKPGDEEIREITDRARNIITQTRPVPETPEEKQIDKEVPAS